MSNITYKYLVDGSVELVKRADLLSALRAVNPEAKSVDVTQLDAMGMSRKEALIAIAINLGSSIAANNAVDAAKAIEDYFHAAGIQATQVDQGKVDESSAAHSPTPKASSD